MLLGWFLAALANPLSKQNIELNPLRAGLVNHPSEYRWSSFNLNALGESRDLLTPHES
jgi:hypothetical protein